MILENPKPCGKPESNEFENRRRLEARSAHHDLRARCSSNSTIAETEASPRSEAANHKRVQKSCESGTAPNQELPIASCQMMMMMMMMMVMMMMMMMSILPEQACNESIHLGLHHYSCASPCQFGNSRVLCRGHVM